MQHHAFPQRGEPRLARFEQFNELVVHVINVAVPNGLIPEAFLEFGGLFFVEQNDA